MQLTTKSLIALRVTLFVLLSFLAYRTGLVTGRYQYYEAGQFTGCNRLANSITKNTGLIIQGRCVITTLNELYYEVTFNKETHYIKVDY